MLQCGVFFFACDLEMILPVTGVNALILNFLEVVKSSRFSIKK